MRNCLRESGGYLSAFSLVFIAILSGALATQTIQAQKAKPFSEHEIIRLLKGDVTPSRVAELARERGIDFRVTPEVEKELRTAGADEALISALRAAAPKPVTPAAPNRPAEHQPTSALAPGTVRINAKDGLKYVWIPPGTFMMGCSPGDNDCTTSEKPSHQVSITKGFWLGQTPVTVLAYRRFAGTTGRAMPAAPNFNASWNTQEMPMVNVTWDDAQAYCAWAGERGCPPKRNGNTRRAPGVPGNGMARSTKLRGFRGTAAVGPTGLRKSSPMRLVFTTCSEMCGSG